MSFSIGPSLASSKYDFAGSFLLGGNECSRLVLFAESTVLITVMNQINQSRLIDICLGLSTEIGIITSAKCCLADDLALIDIETNNQIESLKSEIWINEFESICFMNPVENFDFAFDSPNNTDQCSVKIYDHNFSKFKTYHVENDDIRCEKLKCEFHITLAGNETILDGSAILCGNSVYGIVQKSKIFLFRRPFLNFDQCGLYLISLGFISSFQ